MSPGFLFFVQFDHVVDPEDGDRRLRGVLQRFDLGDGRFEDAVEATVTHFARLQIESEPFQRLFVLLGLRSVVIRAKLSDQIRGILRSVDAQGFGNGEQGRGELGDGQLFARTLKEDDISGERNEGDVPLWWRSSPGRSRELFRSTHLPAPLVSIPRHV